MLQSDEMQRSENRAVLRLLRQALQERMDQKLERVFRLLGLRYPPADIYSAYSGLRSQRSDLRASAIEFLDNLPERTDAYADLSPEESAAAEFLDRFDITFSLVAKGKQCPPWCDKKSHTHGICYDITFTKPERDNLEFPFWDSQHNQQLKLEPTAYSVLACISNDAYCPDKFEDFCSEYGYEEDSRTAEKLFNRCSEFSDQINNFFTAEEIEALSKIR